MQIGSRKIDFPHVAAVKYLLSELHPLKYREFQVAVVRRNLEQQWMRDDFDKLAARDGLNLDSAADRQKALDTLTDAYSEMRGVLVEEKAIRYLPHLDDEFDMASVKANQPATVEDVVSFYRENGAPDVWIDENRAAIVDTVSDINKELEAQIGQPLPDEFSNTDWQDYATLQEQFRRTDFNYGYSDDAQARERRSPAPRPVEQADEQHEGRGAQRARLEADAAHLELEFPYFIDKKAPITGMPGKLDIEVTFECNSNGTDDFIMGIKVPATSLCPCSKEISKYGAHNQRCEIEAKIRSSGSSKLWIEDVVKHLEAAASHPVYAVLKRPDEKYVTEKAYENPKFVEDMVRDVAARLNEDDRVRAYCVESENFESIHNHSAYALVEHDKDLD